MQNKIYSDFQKFKFSKKFISTLICCEIRFVAVKQIS